MRLRGFLEKDYKIFYIADQETKNYGSHCHGFHKVVLILNGHVDYTIEGRTHQINGKCVLFVKKNQVHNLTVYGDEVYERLVLYLSEGFIGALAGAGLNVDALFDDVSMVEMPEDKDVLVRDILYEFKHMYTQKASTDIYAEDCLLKLLMSRLSQLKTKAAASTFEKNIVYDQRILRSLDYIAENLSGRITVDDLAGKVFLSRYHFMRLFKNETGLSVYQYVIQKRLVLAHDKILAGNDYQKAAGDAGFSDYSIFLKSFVKKYGANPRKYFSEKHFR